MTLADAPFRPASAAPDASAGDAAHGWLLLRGMLRIRRFEETCAELYSAEKIRGFLHLYLGEEAVAVGAMRARTPDDAVVSTYREHGHTLEDAALPQPEGIVRAALDLLGTRAVAV